MLEVGLRRVLNSPAKFEEILNYLHLLLERIKEESFPQDAEEVMRGLYGQEPSLRAAQILNLASELKGQEEEEGARDTILKLLRQALNAEIRDVIEEY